MKIGLVFDDSLDRPDGVQQYVTAIGGWLAGQGHEVHYLVGQTSRQDLPNVHSLSRNISVTFNGNNLSTPRPASAAAIRSLLQTEKFDVLHVMMPYSPMMAGVVIKNAPANAVVAGTFHILPQSLFVRLATNLLGMWLRNSLRRFDRVFAVSRSAKEFAGSAFGLQDVTVLPNVVDTTVYQGVRGFEKYDDATPTVMFLGRLVPRKGCATLLDAVYELRKTYDGPLRVLVCGKGPLEAELKTQAARLGIADIVEFTGFISEADKPRYLASADMAVFPSTGGESFGIVLIEAMAASVGDGSGASDGPVVLAANNPGYATVMEPRPGQLFKPGDSKELAAKMARYLGDDNDRRSAVSWQSEYVRDFDTDTVGRQLLENYSTLLDNRLRK